VKKNNFFGRRLRWLRDEQGYGGKTGAQNLSESIGVSVATIYNWEKREYPPPNFPINELAATFGKDSSTIRRMLGFPIAEPAALESHIVTEEGEGFAPRAYPRPTKGPISERSCSDYLMMVLGLASSQGRVEEVYQILKKALPLEKFETSYNPSQKDSHDDA
jgi:transcriptional regulator with XRE-family HTH domain